MSRIADCLNPGINYASAYGLKKGTNLQGNDFSWLGSIFYFGTFVKSHYPLNMFSSARRIPGGRISIRLPSPATANWESLKSHHHRVGGHCDDNASMHKLRRHSYQQVYAGPCRVCSQSGLCPCYGDVVYFSRAASTTRGLLLYEKPSTKLV